MHYGKTHFPPFPLKLPRQVPQQGCPYWGHLSRDHTRPGWLEPYLKWQSWGFFNVRRRDLSTNLLLNSKCVFRKLWLYPKKTHFGVSSVIRTIQTKIMDNKKEEKHYEEKSLRLTVDQAESHINQLLPQPGSRVLASLPYKHTVYTL